MPHQKTQWQFTLAHAFLVTTLVACCLAVGSLWIPILFGIVGVGVYVVVAALIFAPFVFVSVLAWEESRRIFWWAWDQVSTFRDELEQTHQFAAELPDFLQHGCFLDDEVIAQIADDRFLELDKEEEASDCAQ